MWPHELKTAQSFATIGKDAEFIRRSEGQRATSADAVIDGLVWEMKAPTADNLKAVERNLKRGRWQSENIIFDCRRMKKVPDCHRARGSQASLRHSPDQEATIRQQARSSD